MSRIVDVDGKTLLACYPVGVLAATVIADLNAADPSSSSSSARQRDYPLVIALQAPNGQNFLTVPLRNDVYSIVPVPLLSPAPTVPVIPGPVVNKKPTLDKILPFHWDKHTEERLYQAVLEQAHDGIVDWKLLKDSAFRNSPLTSQQLQHKWTRFGIADARRVETERERQEQQGQQCLMQCVSVVVPRGTSCAWCQHNQRLCREQCPGRRHFALAATSVPFAAAPRSSRQPPSPALLHTQSVQMAVCLFHMGISTCAGELSIEAQTVLRQIHKIRDINFRSLDLLAKLRSLLPPVVLAKPLEEIELEVLESGTTASLTAAIAVAPTGPNMLEFLAPVTSLEILSPQLPSPPSLDNRLEESHCIQQSAAAATPTTSATIDIPVNREPSNEALEPPPVMQSQTTEEKQQQSPKNLEQPHRLEESHCIQQSAAAATSAAAKRKQPNRRGTKRKKQREKRTESLSASALPSQAPPTPPPPPSPPPPLPVDKNLSCAICKQIVHSLIYSCGLCPSTFHGPCHGYQQPLPETEHSQAYCSDCLVDLEKTPSDVYEDHETEAFLVERLPQLGLRWHDTIADGWCMWRAITQADSGNYDLVPDIAKVQEFTAKVLDFAYRKGLLEQCPMLEDSDRKRLLRLLAKKSALEVIRALYRQVGGWANTGADPLFKTFCDLAFPWVATLLNKPVVIFNARADQIYVVQPDGGEGGTCTFQVADQPRWKRPNAILLLRFGCCVEHTDVLQII